MSSPREIRSLTGLRGVAAVYVVFFHYFDGLKSRNPLAIFLNHGYLAVDLFFVLSGFVMTLNYRLLFRDQLSVKAYFVFLGRRIARVYPLYLAGTIAGFLLVLAHQLEGPRPGELLKTALLNLGMLQCWVGAGSLDAPGWSISAEWAAYLLFPMLLGTVFFRRGLLGWTCVLSSIAAMVGFWYLPHALGQPELTGSFFSMGMLPVLRCLPEFTLGILVVRCLGTRLEHRAVERPWVASVVCVAIFALLMVWQSDLLIVLLCPLLILSLLAAKSVPARLLSWRPVHYLGVLSYSIYIVHDLLGGLMGTVHRYAAQHGLAHAQTYATAVGIALTFPLSMLAYRFIEAPGRKVLRHVFEGPQMPRKEPEPISGGPVGA
jgi:peptidoglycan/LPS O-acetylase OafA/YrhL